MKGKDRPVYSTDFGDQRRTPEHSKSFRRGAGPCRVRKEKKGRGGKTVTVVENIPLEMTEAKVLLKALQQRFACGGKLGADALELQGDFGDQARSFLTQYFAGKA